MKIFRKIDELITMQGAEQKAGRRIAESDLSILKKAAFVVEGGRILWMGKDSQIPKLRGKATEHKLDGKLVAPGFIDCHTHFIFAGDRSEEFEWRQQGIAYREITMRGGGIFSSMRSTRKASPDKLFLTAQKRLSETLRFGVTTLEIKSGYGLNLKDELKQLKVAKKLGDLSKGKKPKGPRVVPTFLGAHALPPEFLTEELYLEELIQFLPSIKKLGIHRVDIFIEQGFFSSQKSAKYLQAAKSLGFDLVIHADQLSLSGGAQLAVKNNAKSADHLICIGPEEIQKLAESEVTCVLLPAADLYMKCAYPPARALIDAGARVALASDFNPGSSPTQDLSLVGLLARLQMKMSLPEVFNAFTVAPAKALGLENEAGCLTKDRLADFFVSSLNWQQFFYQAGHSLAEKVFIGGEEVICSP